MQTTTPIICGWEDNNSYKSKLFNTLYIVLVVGTFCFEIFMWKHLDAMQCIVKGLPLFSALECETDTSIMEDVYKIMRISNLFFNLYVICEPFQFIFIFYLESSNGAGYYQIVVNTVFPYTSLPAQLYLHFSLRPHIPQTAISELEVFSHRFFCRITHCTVTFSFDPYCYPV